MNVSFPYSLIEDTLRRAWQLGCAITNFDLSNVQLVGHDMFVQLKNGSETVAEFDGKGALAAAVAFHARIRSEPKQYVRSGYYIVRVRDGEYFHVIDGDHHAIANTILALMNGDAHSEKRLPRGRGWTANEGRIFFGDWHVVNYSPKIERLARAFVIFANRPPKRTEEERQKRMARRCNEAMREVVELRRLHKRAVHEREVAQSTMRLAATSNARLLEENKKLIEASFKQPDVTQFLALQEALKSSQMQNAQLKAQLNEAPLFNGAFNAHPLIIRCAELKEENDRLKAEAYKFPKDADRVKILSEKLTEEEKRNAHLREENDSLKMRTAPVPSPIRAAVVAADIAKLRARFPHSPTLNPILDLLEKHL